ncbi:hypothetical protein [Flavobacterium sp. FlaQc-48]|uniref:hypothetical protein n=1 Tax=Flavobacterium sp. FlaQc-48 TaxID=3374181 RepID=UPI003756D6FA
MILVLSGYYGNSQSLLTVLDGLEKPNGTPFSIQLNPTSTPTGCTSQTITLKIGKLTYMPASSTIPPEVIVIPQTTNGETTLTISGIVNEKEGVSRTIIIGAQFAPGTCDGVIQQITASIVSTGCNSTPVAATPITVTSKTLNNARVSLYKSSEEQDLEPYCLRKMIKYTLTAHNGSNNIGFTIMDAKFYLELDKCAEIIGIYKRDTYESVDPVITAGANVQTAVFNIPDLKLSLYGDYQYYDLYVRYPCLDGVNDCTSGYKKISAYVKGKSCGADISSPIVNVQTQISTSNSLCGDLSCGGGSGGGTTPIVILQSQLRCVTDCNTDSYVYFYLYTSPLNFSYPNQKFIVDLPMGLNVTGSGYRSTPCGSIFKITYLNSAGERSPIPYSGSLTRKVEFETSCSLMQPSNSFVIYFNYDKVNPPASEAKLSFNYKFTSDEKVITSGSNAAQPKKCSPALYSDLRVKKAATTYEAATDVNGLPGEIFTYVVRIYNFSTGDTNTVLSDVLNQNLEYAGGFKYYGANGKLQDLLANKSFTIPDIGTVAVAVPKVGESGTIVLSGFDFPCTSKTLDFQFNVRVKDHVTAGTVIRNFVEIPVSSVWGSNLTYIRITPLTYVKSKMFVKCALADEWKDTGINVKNGEEVDFKMQITNAGSNPILLSELINLKPQPNDQYEFGSGARKSTFKINYTCSLPEISTSLKTIPAVSFQYAQNAVTMDRDMLCPPQTSGNVPNWTAPCGLDANWLKATFPKNFTLAPGDFVSLVYKAKISGDSGVANNSFAFKVVDSNGNCNIVSDNSNVLAITNDGVGIGCNSCTLTNPNAAAIKKLVENLLNNIITRLINGETDAQINGTQPNELFLLKPYITSGGGDKIYHFSSVRNAQNKITGIRFSFSANSENDVSFLEENGLLYNPEIGSVDNSYLKVDSSVFVSPDQYLTTCRKVTDENGNVSSGTDCKNRTEVRFVNFCPDQFCVPANGEIKVIAP